jgi:hypothetical protein
MAMLELIRQHPVLFGCIFAYVAIALIVFICIIVNRNDRVGIINMNTEEWFGGTLISSMCLRRQLKWAFWLSIAWPIGAITFLIDLIE